MKDCHQLIGTLQSFHKATEYMDSYALDRWEKVEVVGIFQMDLQSNLTGNYRLDCGLSLDIL